MADGNLISTGVGDGEAYLIKPFQTDNSFIRINEDRAQRRASQIDAQKKADAKKQDDLLGLVDDTYKYDPLDDVPIKKLRKDFLDLVYKGADERAIREAALGINVLTNDSLNTFKARNESQKVLREQGDTNWIDGEDDFRASQIPSTATDLGGAAQAVQARQMGLDKLKVGSAKIKDVIGFTKQVVSSIPPESTEAGAPTKDIYGNIHTPINPIYNTDAVKDALSIAYQTHKRDLEPIYKTEQSYIDFGMKDIKTAGKINVKGQSGGWNSNNSSSGGSGSVVIGDAVFNHPNKEVFVDTENQDKLFNSTLKIKREKIAQIKDPKIKEQALKDLRIFEADREGFNKRNPFSESTNVYQFSIKGNAENSPRQFTVIDGDASKEISGTSKLYLKDQDAFRVVGKDGTIYIAPLSSNMGYITDVMASNEADFKKGLGIADKGNVVTTNKKGGSTSVSTGTQVYPKSQEEWDNAPKGSFYITKTGKKIIK